MPPGLLGNMALGLGHPFFKAALRAQHGQVSGVSVGLPALLAPTPRITSSFPNVLFMRIDSEPKRPPTPAPFSYDNVPTATADSTKLSSKCQPSSALSDTHLTWLLYWVFISWGGLNRMKGRLARCKWLPFDYLKAHLIKLDSLPAWGKLNEN